MKPLKVLVVDDTPIAREILEGYIAGLPQLLEQAGSCKNAPEAYTILAHREVDLLLLDINMPEMSGIELVRTLKNPPMIIFTTAYPEFAVESYDVNAVDYLLKPVSFDRFLKAIDKARDLAGKQSAATTDLPHIVSDVLFVKTDRKLVKIDLDKLWLVEGEKVYTRLWTGQSTLLAYGTMKHIASQLAHLPQFLRVSKSYIINMRYVNEIEGNVIRINNRSILIGNTYREEVKQRFDDHKLL